MYDVLVGSNGKAVCWHNTLPMKVKCTWHVDNGEHECGKSHSGRVKQELPIVALRTFVLTTRWWICNFEQIDYHEKL